MRGFSYCGTIIGAVLLVAAAPGATQAQTPLPTVHVLATGGTISNTGGSRRTGEELISAIPGIERFANVTVEQFSNVASGSITPDHWKQIAARINEVYRTRPEVKGIVVTHGTDTLEETAFFLDLTVESCNPVVVTGSMRQATAVGADGPANLFNAVRLAASPDAAKRGTLVLLNDEAFTARSVSKTNTLRVNAFTAPETGPAAVVDPDGIVFYHKPERDECGTALFDVAPVETFPRVDIIYVYSGADSVLISASVAAGARGLVVAGAGAGAATPAQSRALGAARAAGVFIVTSNRTGSGRVANLRGDVGNLPDGRGAQMGAGTLNPQKARVLLMLGLATGADPQRILDLLRLP